MPNNQQKEEVNCKVCGKPLDDNHCFTVANGKAFQHIPEPPENDVRFKCKKHTIYCKCMNQGGLCQNQHYADCLRECQPESMVTTLEEDRKLLKQYSAVTSDLLAGMLICNRDWQAWELGTMTEDDFFDASDDDDSVGQIDAFIEKLLAAKERVVRAECAEIVNKIEKRIEGDRTVRLGFVLSEIDEAKSKILNNSPL